MTNELLIQGKKALSTGEWEKARQLLEVALHEEALAEVYEELAWACWWLNDALAVFEYRAKAYQLFLENNNRLGASRNASWTGLDYIELKGEFAVASGWFQRAENLLEGLPDSWELGLIKNLKARWTFQVEKNSELAYQLIDESLNLSKALNNVEGVMLAEALKGFFLVLEGKIAEGMPLLDDATLLALTTEQGDAKITTITCCFMIDACERVRDYERASQWCNHVKEICKRWRYKAMFANCRMKHAGVLIWKGNWKEAEEELVSTTTELKKFRPAQINACTVRLADLKRRQGKWDEAVTLLNEVESHPLKPLYCATLYFDQGEYEKAQNLAERYLRGISIQEKAERTTGVELLLRIYIKLGKYEPAQSVLQELREIAGAIHTLPLKAALMSAEGNVNFICDNYELAKQHLEDAVDIYDRLQLPFEASRTRLLLAEVLIKHTQFAQAEAELNTAITAFKALGAAKDFEKAKYLHKNLYIEHALEANQNQFEFTGRELEVLRLIVEGKNNEVIADKLFLSVRTVEKHITNIYSKMGVSGKSARAFAAAYAIKHHLIFA